MSYDVWLSINTGCHSHQVVELGNYTSNVSSMWDTACEAVGSPHLRDLRDRKCSEIAPGLIAAVRWMVANRERLIHMEPENKWGNYKGAVRYLARIAQACRDNPLCVLEMWK